VGRFRVTPTSCLCQHLVEIPIVFVAAVRLLESNLQLASQPLVQQTLNVIACDENVDALGAVVLDLDRLAGSSIKRLTLFVSEFWNHE
jgi:hypothetical protein